MYDNLGRKDYEYWSNFNKFKIINLSITLHNKLKKWGFQSIYVKYFPKPSEFFSGNKEEIFFWQRLTHININVISKLFARDKFKIHLHKAVDPYQDFIEPSKVMEKDFQISYSNWFKNKDEMLEIVRQKGIYVAPREYEGIGMSFLEAMAMGKAVIAVDNPTMNEYIKNGETGYLFDLKNVKKLDLSRIDEVQKNVYKYMQEGYRKWEKDKSLIINFIKQN
jgi:glycosyltransferase involved in cell wall biosynthesis